MTVPLPNVTFRPATERDLPACAALWRDAINDYQSRLNQPLIADEPGSTGRLGRLHAHTLATDPDRFVVACRPAASGPDDVVAFGSAVVRGDVWFLSMLFVRPDLQGAGIGRALLERILPGADRDLVLATATDSAQPVSNALYASLGIVPRLPLWSLGGGPGASELPLLPAGIAAVPFAAIAGSPSDHVKAGGAGPDDQGHAMLVETIDEIDRETVGFAHPADHGHLRTTEARGYLYLGPDGRALGYGYASPAGRVGPVAVREAALLAPVVRDLLVAVAPRGGQAIWVPGEAGALLSGLVRSGFRIDGFPVLLSWSRSFADFGRYLPLSPGLL